FDGAQDVAEENAGAFRGAAGGDGDHKESGIGRETLRTAGSFRERDRLHADAEIPSGNAAALEKLIDNPVHGGRGDQDSRTARAGGGHAEGFAARIDDGTGGEA